MAKSDEYVNSTRGALQHYAENPKSAKGQRLSAINNWQQTVLKNPEKFNEEEKGLMTSLAQETLESVKKGERQVSKDPKEQEAYNSLMANTPKKEGFLDKAKSKIKEGVSYAQGTAQFVSDSYKEIWQDVKDTVREQKEFMAEDKQSIKNGLRAGKESVKETLDNVKNSQAGKAVTRQANKTWMNIKYGMGFASKEEMDEKVWQPEDRRKNITAEWKESRRQARAQEGKENLADKARNLWGNIKEAGSDAKDSFDVWNIERQQKNAEKKAQKEKEKAEKEAKRAHRKEVIARWKESRAEAKRIKNEAKKKAKAAKRAERKAKWSNRWKTAKKWLKRAVVVAAIGTAVYATGGLAAVAMAGGVAALGYGAKAGIKAYRNNKQQKKAERAEFMKSNPKSKDEAIALVQQYQKDNAKNKQGNAFEALSAEQLTETWKQLGGKEERKNLNMQYNRNLDGMALAHKDAFYQLEHASENIMKKIASGEIQITKENGQKYAAWLAVNKETAFGNYTDKNGNTASIKDRNAEIEAILKANGIEVPDLHQDKVNQTQVEGQNRATEDQKRAETQQESAVQSTDKTQETKQDEQKSDLTTEQTAQTKPIREQEPIAKEVPINKNWMEELKVNDNPQFMKRLKTYEIKTKQNKGNEDLEIGLALALEKCMTAPKEKGGLGLDPKTPEGKEAILGLKKQLSDEKHITSFNETKKETKQHSDGEKAKTVSMVAQKVAGERGQTA